MKFTLSPFEFFVLRTRTRFPFRYGIASLTDVPQFFVTTRVSDGRGEQTGLAAEGLPPKWFTKDPATTFEQDLPQMTDVVTHAAGLAVKIARSPIGFFDLWVELIPFLETRRYIKRVISSRAVYGYLYEPNQSAPLLKLPLRVSG